MPTRRRFLTSSAASAAALALPRLAPAATGFQLNYIVSSAMFGTTPLAEILPEVGKAGARHIDIWPRVHANHREQITEMGLDAFAELLEANKVELGVLTHYGLGPMGLTDEFPVAERFGCKLIVTGAKGAPKPKGISDPASLRTSVTEYVEKLRPHLDQAAERGVTIAIENHANSLIHTPDSMRWLADAAPANLGIAFAPHHLPQDPELQSKLITELGGKIAFFYAQQYGKGAKEKLPKEEELLQMPGRGPLDFAPLISSLKSIAYGGFTEIFMHPVPRGIPILETTPAVTAEINKSRTYLDSLI